MSRAKSPLLADRYRLTGRLGSGGMSHVHLATDEVLARQVALKVLPSDSPEEALARFRREARVGASLNHPNVVAIWDSEATDDALLIAMEYVEGETLRDRIDRGPLSPEEAIPVLEQIASALDHLHSAGVVHRDVKPSNILIRPDGIAKLADLGIAAGTDLTEITAAGSIVGTLLYLSPERLRDGAAAPASDVYALAVTAYEALAGSQPYEATTPPALLKEIESGDLDLREGLEDAPPSVVAALRRGAAPDPGERQGSAGALVADLRAAYERAAPDGATAIMPVTAEAEPTEVAPPPPAEPPPSPRAEPSPSPPPPPARSPSRVPAVLALLGGLALVAVVAALALGGGDDPEPGPSRAGGGDTQTQGASERQTQPEETPPAATEGEPPEEGSVSEAEALALNDRGYALVQDGDPESAIPLLEDAVDGLPEGSLEYGYALFNLANAYRLAGRPEEAIPLLRERLTINDQLDVVRAELALAREEAAE